MKNNKKGFTLAEILIVLVVLGVVAMIVVPPVIKKYQEASERTKLKKAMTIYDGAIARMVIENDLKTSNALTTWAKQDNNTCSNSVAYFKASDINNCTFKTSDGVYWDISDIMNPIIATSKSELQKAQQNGTDGSKSFKLVTSFDAILGTFRVDDIGFEKAKLSSELALAPEETRQDVIKKVEELEKLFSALKYKLHKTSEFMKNCVMQKTAEGQPRQCKIGNATFTEQKFTTGTYDPSIGGCNTDSTTCADIAANSKAEEGTYYTANLGGNRTWDEVQRVCKNIGGSIATAAQLQQMKRAGTLNCLSWGSCVYWTSDSSGSNGVYFNPYNGKVYVSSKDDRASNIQTVCVGN